jgi:hypothetical protein
MSKITISAALAAAAVAVTLGLGPATAAPVSNGEALKAQAPGLATAAHSPRRAKPRRHVRRYGAPRYAYPDTVGSLGFDGYGYAYNRFSGQRYMSCVTDEGYGRVRPCDAGDGGGGGRN